LNNKFCALNLLNPDVYLVITNGKLKDFQKIGKFTETQNNVENIEKNWKFVYEDNLVIFIYIPQNNEEFNLLTMRRFKKN
jgi:hypothetical protein